MVSGDFTGMANSFLFLMFLSGWLDLSERAEKSCVYFTLFNVLLLIYMNVCLFCCFGFGFFLFVFFPDVIIMF